MRSKKSKLISCIICIAVCITAMVPVQFPAYAAVKSGNTTGNLANYGQVAQSGEWIYFESEDCHSSSHYLCKVKTDGTGFTKLVNKASGGISDINVVDGWVYYVSEDKKVFSWYLYKVRTDGKENQRILKHEVYPGCVTVIGEWIYYIDSFNYSIYKIKTDGTKKTKIANTDCANSFSVSENWIYYTDSDLWKVKTNGQSKKRIKKNSIGFDSCQVSNSWVYCTDNDLNLYKMRTDGKKNKKVASNVLEYNVTGGWIYYSVIDKGFYKVKVDGTSKKKISNKGGVCLIHILDDTIYLQNIVNRAFYKYRMKTDGTKLQYDWYGDWQKDEDGNWRWDDGDLYWYMNEPIEKK